MQLLFESSNEYGKNEGLNLIKGKVKKIDFKSSKLPVVGWFKIKAKNKSFIYKINNKNIYLVHSYECLPENDKIVCGHYILNDKKKNYMFSSTR